MQDIAARLVVANADDDAQIVRLLADLRAVASSGSADAARVAEGERLLVAAQAVVGDARSRLLADAARVLTGEAKAETAAPRAAPTGLDAAFDRELLGDFVVESRAHLSAAEAALLALESQPDDAEHIGTVFRAFHTIKGCAGLASLEELGAFAHAAESLLARIRNGTIRCVGHQATLALRAVDALREYVDAVERSIVEGGPVKTPPAAAALGRELAASLPPAPMEGAPAAVGPAQAALDALPPDALPRAAAKVDDAAWMRVRIERLDRLIDMVGELVIAQSMVSQDPVPAAAGHAELRRKIAHASKIVRELQELSMGLRMVPLKATFQRLARVLRDVSARTGKTVRLALEGEETEIDRGMVDVLADPLVHMIRNGVDHGIEPRDVRLSRGKPESGTLWLGAHHSGGNLVIQLRDDGQGMDRAVIVKKAIERGLIASDAKLSDAEVLALIFAPGFSTRDAVNDVSGRGVGMDVVKRAVDQLKGRIETTSAPGVGTTFTIHVPLTLAVTDGMLVRVGGERFILPTTAIRTTFRPAPDAIRTIGDRGEFVRVRDESVPVFRLHRIFDIPDAEVDPSRALIVVMDGEDGRVGFVVDELLAQQQVVSKPLAHARLAVPGVSGGAILGDGRVGLILDPPGLVALARQTFASDSIRRTALAAGHDRGRGDLQWTEN